MAQNYFYPPSGGASANPSIGANGITAPSSSTEVGGINPSGNQQPLQTDAAGNLKVVVESGSTSAQNVNLVDVGGAAIALGQTTMSASLPVAIASNQSTLPISAASLPLPAGAATSANQTTMITDLAQISTNTAGIAPGSSSTGEYGYLEQGVTSASSPSYSAGLVEPLSLTLAGALRTDSSAVTQPVSAASLPLPTGAATNAELVTINSTLGSPFQAGGSIGNTSFGISGSLPAGTNAIGSVSVSNFPSTQPVSGTVTVTQATAANLNATVVGTGTFAVQAAQSGTWNINNISGTISLPTGAATSANQTSEITQLTAINSNTSHLPTALGQTTASASLPVVLASNQSSIPTTNGGNTPNGFVRLVYSVTNVTTTAYVQLIASTTNATNVAEIFDSSGQTLEIAFGASGSEVPQFIVYPGGNGRITVAIPASTRISIKALSATASAGEIDLNLYT